MKKLLLLLMAITTYVYGQTTISTCSGLYTFTNQTCTKLIIGDGTSGSIKICLENTLSGSKCTPGGSCNPPYNGGGWNPMVNIYAATGSPLNYTGTATNWFTTTSVGTCITLSTTNGYAVIFGNCLTAGTISWTTVNECGLAICDGPNPCSGVTGTNNDYIVNALLIDQCGTNFTSTNNGATNNYSSTQTGCGSVYSNLDCNTTTTGFGSGNDVPWSIEDDIWYKFCPTTTGTWTITVTGTNCSNSGGYQLGIFQGIPTNLNTTFYTSSCTQTQGISCVRSLTGTTSVVINVTSTTNCVYIVLDGHAGAVCNFSVSLQTTSCNLTPLPIELLQFIGHSENLYNVLQWSTASELNNNYFTLERSIDVQHWNHVVDIQGSGTSTTYHNYQYHDYLFEKDTVNYYRLSQTDYNGKKKYFNIVAIQSFKTIKCEIYEYYDMLGNSIDIKNVPPGIYFRKCGSKVEKIWKLEE